MTTITFFETEEGTFKAVECKGHAGFADYGNDIVCSAISVLTINTINSIQSFTKDEILISQDEDKGLIRFDFKDIPSDEANLLLRSYALGVRGIFEEYGKKFLNIKIRRV